MKNSIKIKLFAVICAIAMAFVGILTVLNLFFYKDYYLYERKHALVTIYHELNSSYTGSVSQIFDMLLQLENSSAVRISIIGKDGLMKYDSFYRERRKTGTEPPAMQANDYDENLTNALLAAADKTALAKTGYTFTTSRTAPRGGHAAHGEPGGEPVNDFLCLVGTLRVDGQTLIVRIPMAYMQQNSSFNSMFLLIAGLATLLICMALAYFVSRQFTRPLIEIEEVATAMADLNFSKTYTGTSSDEIGRLGQSINRLSEHLEQAISDLKRTNEELAHEVEEKERIDNMRQEFVVNVSHELKTPIALIQGYAEGLRVGVTQEESDREYYCDIIVDESRRMNHLVMQLLDLSKLELGREIPDPTDVELYPLCDAVAQKLAVLREGRGQHIRYEDCQETVYADYGMMEQVLMNYLSNAIRYTPNGGKIHVSTARLPDGAVELRVDNQGEPIPESELDMIFEKFYRTDKARSRESGGTGIGLSIVRAIAEAHGGACGAVNLPDGIVRFWFRIPAQLPTPPAP